MSPTTFSQRPSSSSSILEHVRGSPSRIDRNARVIRGVKVLGFASTNTGRVLGLDAKEYGPALDRPYRYDPDAVRAALPLYEGIAVNVDHPPHSEAADGRRILNAGRGTAERFGRLVNVRVTEDGLMADLEYLASHPLAEMILETAERMPEQLALSHHARCEFGLEGGQIVARKIVALHSVDVIGDRPGTTRSLFESHPLSTEETPLPLTTLQNLAQSFGADTPAGKSLRQLLESQQIPSDLLIELPGEDPPTETVALEAALRAVLHSVLQNRATDLRAALSSLRPVLEAADPLSEVERENRRLLAREQARCLLEAAGLRPSEPLVQALAALEHRADRDALVQSLATTRPRSSEPLPSPAAEKLFHRPDGRSFAQAARR